MADTTDALRPPFMQRCYTCGRESPAGPMLHFTGCPVGAGTGARLDAVGTNRCKATIATPAGSAEVAALQAEVARLTALEAESFQKYVDANEARIAAEAEAARLRDLLSEVAAHYTRDDDLPDNLLPRIDAALKESAHGQG